MINRRDNVMASRCFCVACLRTTNYLFMVKMSSVQFFYVFNFVIVICCVTRTFSIMYSKKVSNQKFKSHNAHFLFRGPLHNNYQIVIPTDMKLPHVATRECVSFFIFHKSISRYHSAFLFSSKFEKNFRVSTM